jgi:predicted RNA-binding protein YlqC (UPF0109 family)
MGDGSMFEEPDFGRAQAAEDDDVYENDVEDELDDEDEELAAGEAIAGESGDDDDDDDDEDGAIAEIDEIDDEDLGDDEIDDDDEQPDIDDMEGTVNRLRGAAAKAVLDHVTRTLVDDPDSVVVDVSEGRSGLRFSVHVAQGDMGRLIGRKGRTAQAIRALVRAAAASDGTEASVDIVD